MTQPSAPVAPGVTTTAMTVVEYLSVDDNAEFCRVRLFTADKEAVTSNEREAVIENRTCGIKGMLKFHGTKSSARQNSANLVISRELMRAIGNRKPGMPGIGSNARTKNNREAA
jgi:hypothetical protein